MSIAMMLPTTLPLANVFLRLTGRRPDRTRLFALLVVGYLLAWLAFGVIAHLAHALAARWAEGNGWLWTHAWIAPAASLALAGAFQFSRLKDHCLDACRSPLPFVVARWGGLAPSRDALRLGIAHGIYCVGCCWALMLLMFTVGVGSVAWMLLLGALMAIEKNASWGRRIGAPLGIALLAAAGWIAFAAHLPSY
jgi:predicted metal-binding membrane protein